MTGTDDPSVVAPRVTVVVPTIGARHVELGRCLDALDKLTYPHVEVVLVDNRRAHHETDLEDLVRGRARVRLVRQPFPGISAARNAGVAAAAGEIIAFTDDDVVVDPDWVTGIVERFDADPAVEMVAGLILPAELETPAQVWFENYYGGFGAPRGSQPLYFSVTRDSRGRRGHVEAVDESGTVVQTFSVYGAGACGAGANMAFRREWLESHGGFDVTLGIGTASKGGEDLAATIAVLWAGGTVAFEPAAVVFHRHRESYQELREQIRSYGTGFTAMLTSLVVSDRDHALTLARQLPRAVRRQASVTLSRFKGQRPESDQRGDFPAELARLELIGYATGPTAYGVARRRSGRTAR
jgi:cellulose synthase/poly-beta-1,6-N-acetylglucosamine synthase-like glycosyltransferase